MAAASTASGTHCWPSCSPNLPIGFWKQQPSHASGTRVPESLDAFTSLCSASPLPPVEGGGAASRASPRCNSRLCQPRSSACGSSESGVDAARARLTIPVVVLVLLAPVDADGAWAGPCSEGQPGQLRSSAARLCGTASSPAANRSALSVAPTSESSRIPRQGARPPDPLTEAGPCPGAQGALGALGAVGACAGPWGTALGPSIVSPGRSASRS